MPRAQPALVHRAFADFDLKLALAVTKNSLSSVTSVVSGNCLRFAGP
jgi:hypothetical protein